jgi:hypothetical protein
VAQAQYTDHEIQLRYFRLKDDIDALFNQDDLIEFGPKTAWDKLTLLGIEPVSEGEPPFHAWLRVMCAENNIPYDGNGEIPPEIRNHVYKDPALLAWIIFLL